MTEGNDSADALDLCKLCLVSHVDYEIIVSMETTEPARNNAVV